MSKKYVMYENGKMSTSDEGGSGHNYSTTEQVVGTWIDGKPIYEKTLSYTASLSSAGNVDFAHNIANIDTVTDIKGFGVTASGTSVTVNNGRSGNLMGAWAGKANVGLYIGNDDCYRATFKITLQYTKTTD